MQELKKINTITPGSLYSDLVIPILERVAETDSRNANVVYSCLDALKSGYALFSLKSVSLFAFQPKTVAEKTNLKSSSSQCSLK